MQALTIASQANDEVQISTYKRKLEICQKPYNFVLKRKNDKNNGRSSRNYHGMGRRQKLPSLDIAFVRGSSDRMLQSNSNSDVDDCVNNNSDIFVDEMLNNLPHELNDNLAEDVDNDEDDDEDDEDEDDDDDDDDEEFTIIKKNKVKFVQQTLQWFLEETSNKGINNEIIEEVRLKLFQDSKQLSEAEAYYNHLLKRKNHYVVVRILDCGDNYVNLFTGKVEDSEEKMMVPDHSLKQSPKIVQLRDLIEPLHRHREGFRVYTFELVFHLEKDEDYQRQYIHKINSSTRQNIEFKDLAMDLNIQDLISYAEPMELVLLLKRKQLDNKRA
jgi:hypothetical protein